MKKINPKIKIDQESGVMSIELKRGRSVESDISGNAVIDYDQNGNVVRINIYKINFGNFTENQGNIEKFSRDAHIQTVFN